MDITVPPELSVYLTRKPEKRIADFLAGDEQRVRPLAELDLQKARRRHVRQALMEEAAHLSDAWDWVGFTAIYHRQIMERVAELKRLIEKQLGRNTAPDPFWDEFFARRERPDAPWVQYGPQVNVAEAIRQALRRLGLKALPSYLLGLAQQRRKQRRLGLRLFGFFGQAKVDGRNNP